jgi:WhiB family redox-sensing transcriptional regulator
MVGPDWFERAACRGMGWQEFVLDAGSEYSSSIRQLCSRCPVRPECLQFALANPNLCGMWGGTDERERREMRGRSAVTVKMINRSHSR